METLNDNMNITPRVVCTVKQALQNMTYGDVEMLLRGNGGNAPDALRRAILQVKAPVMPKNLKQVLVLRCVDLLEVAIKTHKERRLRKAVEIYTPAIDMYAVLRDLEDDEAVKADMQRRIDGFSRAVVEIKQFLKAKPDYVDPSDEISAFKDEDEDEDDIV